MTATFGDKRLPDRFWAKAAEEPSGCWLWKASISSSGYAQIGVARSLPGLAHRVAYEALVGPIPDGLTIDHLCRHTSCVNPAHMEPVSRRVNIQRAHAARRAERQAAA